MLSPTLKEQSFTCLFASCVASQDISIILCAYSHNAPSAVDGKQFSHKEFYPDDVVKYHGNKNRGIHPIDFTIPVKLPKPTDVAFGVNIAKGSHVHPKPTPEPNPEPEPHDHQNHDSHDHPHPEPEPEPTPEPTDTTAHATIFISLFILSLFHFH